MQTNKELSLQAISNEEFIRLSTFISDYYGVRYTSVKKSILENRLLKRLRHYGFATFSQYCDLLMDVNQNQAELIEMLNLVTTNKTDFFRESNHFDFLTDHVVPHFLENSESTCFNVWSAGCSSGEEVYTLAMVLKEFNENNAEHLQFKVLGTDISMKVLQQAHSGVYDITRVEPIPLELKKKYLLRGKDDKSNIVKIRPELRQEVYFKHLNFMDTDYNLDVNFDLILFRNVMIYFTREVQELVIKRLCKYLKKGGYLFLGHSESIIDMDVPLKQIKPTIFQRL